MKEMSVERETSNAKCLHLLTGRLPVALHSAQVMGTIIINGHHAVHLVRTSPPILRVGNSKTQDYLVLVSHHKVRAQRSSKRQPIFGNKERGALMATC